MIPVDYELGKKIVETCTCECGAGLALCWGGAWGINSHVLKCAADPSHDKVVPIKSLTRLWKEGEPIPSFIADKIERKQRRKLMEQNEVKAMVAKQDADKLGTYLQARFPQDLAKRDAALDFARWCIAHQLEPIRDCVPFAGNPYICVEWLDRQASKDDNFKGYSYKVFSPQDKEALDFDPKDLVVECQASWDSLEKPLVGLGVVTIAEREAKTERGSHRSPVIASHPQQMVFKRARAAVLKQRYHIPAPILEELPYTTIMETEYRVVTEEPSTQGAKARAQATKSENTSATETKSPDDVTEEEGFNIDIDWLKESQKTLKWTDDTCKTFLVSQYKVSPQGTLQDVIKRLTREQAEDFTRRINDKLEKQSSLF